MAFVKGQYYEVYFTAAGSDKTCLRFIAAGPKKGADSSLFLAYAINTLRHHIARTGQALPLLLPAVGAGAHASVP